jgi:regulator of protease activity HflC (stomatin/prohibitin superfamily)
LPGTVKLNGGEEMKLLVRLGNVVGIHFVPENHVVAVMRLGMYHRLGGPGFIWRIPLIESVTPPIKIGIRFLPFVVKRALTKDAISINVDLTVLYSFDPSLSIRQIAAQLVRCTPDVLEGIVEDKVDNCLRQIVARFEAKQLCEGETIVQIQHELSRSLTAELRPLGLSPAQDGGVMIKEVNLPEDLLRTILEAKRHELTLEVLKKYGDGKIDKAVIAEFANNPASQDGALPLLMLANLLGLPGIVGGNAHQHARSALQREP